MLFVKSADFAPVKVPSLEVLGCDKATGLTTFIGCDAHPATAEIRPGPARTIYQHLADVAHGVSSIHEHLSKPVNKYLKLMALPWVDDEALGGHIHVSFFADEPDTKIVMEEMNYVYHVSNLRVYDPNSPMNEKPTKAQCEAVLRYTDAARKGTAFTPESVVKVLNHLTLPFEMWMQPWQEREKRYNWCVNGSHYNQDPNYLVRWVNGTRPLELFPSFAYLHVEYRTPSTWLHHPALAYVYFALAKLTMANYDKVRELTAASRPVKVMEQPGNHIFKGVFLARLETLSNMKLIWPNDTKDLWKMVDLCGRSREAWYSNRNIGVCFDAWKGLL